MANPTFIWLAYKYNIDPAVGMLAISLLGALISFIALLNSSYRNSITMFAVWILYLSLYKVRAIILDWNLADPVE